MDAEAARRARRKAITADLRDAYSDEEAAPPEWVDLMLDIDDTAAKLRGRASEAVARFASEPDVRVALDLRTRAERDLRAGATALNERVRRLNLIAPHERFQRAGIDADELVRPLYRTPRRVTGSSS